MSERFFGVAPSTAVRGRLVTLRTLKAEDFDLLCRWFADPPFIRWWGGRPLSTAEVEATFFDGRDNDFQPMIVEERSCPVGYIQAWIEDGCSGGIDIVLESEARGRGLGTDAVRTLADWLRRERGWTRITVDPRSDNATSIRAFEKAGFVKERDLPDAPEGPAILMVFRPAAT